MTDQKEDFFQTPSQQDILPIKNNRRSTILVRSQNQTVPPIANPNNSDEVNEKLKKEYKSLQLLNKALGSVLQDFETTSGEIQQFSQTLDRTDKLLSIWLSVLEKTEDTKAILEDEFWPNHEKHQSTVSKKIEDKKDENNRKKRVREH